MGLGRQGQRVILAFDELKCLVQLHDVLERTVEYELYQQAAHIRLNHFGVHSVLVEQPRKRLARADFEGGGDMGIESTNRSTGPMPRPVVLAVAM